MDTLNTPSSLTPASPETGSPLSPKSPASATSVTSSPVPRSCLPCKARKVRCDKHQPCQTCMRAGRTCTYPPAGPRVRRTKKTMMAAMAARIAELEKEVKTRASISSRSTKVVEAATTTTKPAVTTIPPSKDTTDTADTPRQDILVQDGASSQYFNEVLLSRVMADNLGPASLETLAPTENEADAPAASASAFNALGILSSPSPLPPARLHPSRAVAVQLWTLYLERVDGCSGLKLLHVPTDQVRVFAVIDNPPAAAPDHLALCFAIYYGAQVAREEYAAEHDALLLQYKLGLEQSLAHADFLDRPTVTSLLALAIYLAALRFCNRGKGLWVLNGLAVRVAQSLGLHRDGGRLRLTPFEAERRRRLWWHLVTRDGRASEDYGVEVGPAGAGTSADVLLPLNVDDADLRPDMAVRPAPAPGWTAMTFSLIYIALCRTAQRLASEPLASSDESRRAAIVADLRADVERQLAQCNPVLPQQRMTVLCAHFLLRKLDFVSRLQWAIRRGDAQSDDLVNDANLAEALALLRPRLFREEELLVQYAWARKAFPQYHIAMYVLWHLCLQPGGPHADEAWTAVELLFREEEEQVASRGQRGGGGTGLGSKFAVLAALKAKAEAVRRQRYPLSAVSSAGAVATTAGAAFPMTSPSAVFNDFLLDSEMLDFGLDDVWSAWADGQAL